MSRFHSPCFTATTALPYIFVLGILGAFCPFYIDLFVNITVRRLALLSSSLLLITVIIYNNRVVLSPGEGAMIFLYILLLGSIAWAYAPVESANRVFDSLFLASFYVLFVISATNRIRNWWRALVVYSLLVTVLALVYSVLGYQFDGAVNQNGISRFLIVSIPILSIESINAERREVSAWLLCCAGINSLIVLNLGSRSGFISLCVIIPLLVVSGVTLLDKKNIEAYGIVSSLAGILIALLSWSSIAQLLERIPRSLETVTPEMLGADRYAIYVVLIDVLRDNWAFGIGYGSFPVVMAEVHRKGFIAHGFILRLWVGAGVLAVILIFYAILCAFRGYVAKVFEGDYITSDGIRAIGLCIALCGLIATGLFNPLFNSSLFILLLALGTGAFKQPLIE